MKKTIIFITVFTISIYSFNSVFAKEINFNSTHSFISTIDIFDSPSKYTKKDNDRISNFFNLLNKYKNVIVFSIEIDTNFTKNDSGFLINNDSIYNCFKGDNCFRNINHIELKAVNEKFKQELSAEMWKKSGYLAKPDNGVAIVFFNSNQSLKYPNVSNGFEIKFYYDTNLVDSFSKLSTQYNSIEVENELNIYKKILKNPTNCMKLAKTYCDILNSKQNQVATSLDSNETSDLRKRLILDFAILNRNDLMSLFLFKRNIKSLHFSTKKALLYAASFYDLKEIIDIVGSSEIIDYRFQNGLTALGVAIGTDSKKAVETLIEKRAVNVGNLYKNFWINKSNLSSSEDFEIVDMFLKKYNNESPTPSLISDIIIRNMQRADSRKILWFKNFQKKYPSIFNELIVENNDVSKELFLASSYLKEPIFYNFLVKKGLNKCLIHKIRRVYKNQRLRHPIPKWYINQFEDNSVMCQ